MGEPDKDTAAKLVVKFDPLFPAKSDCVNRELAQLLVYLKSPTIVEKVCTELKKPSKPLTQAGLEELLARNRGYGGTIANLHDELRGPAEARVPVHAAQRHRRLEHGARKTYFGFLAEARTKSGGASFQGFINNIEKDAFDNATDADRLAIEAAKLRPAFKPKALPKAIGPGKDWTTEAVVALEAKLKGGRNFKNGERTFAAARCVVCHRFDGDGGATGPDLSQVAGRFSLKDLCESIVEPSKVISDQYKAIAWSARPSDKTYTGRIVSDANGKSARS